MSKELRKFEMQAAAEKIDKLLRGNLVEIEEQINQLPEDVFKEPFKADFEEGQEGLIKTEILRHANELVNSAASEEANEAPYIIDYAGLGLTNVALQAQNFLKQHESEDVMFLEKCQIKMKDVDQSIAMLEKMNAAIEFRLNNGDDIGEMGRLKELTPDEDRALLRKIQEMDLNLQEALSSVIESVFRSQKDEVTDTISALCRKVLKGDGDPYIEVNPENERAVSNLRKIGLVSNHPHNSWRVKLINMD